MIPSPILRVRILRSKKLLIPAAVVAAALAALLIIPALVNIDSYRAQIVSRLEQRLGRTVTLGALSLRLLPRPLVRADDVTIGEDPQFASGPFIKAKSVRLRIGLWSLLSGQPEVSGIELTEPEVALIKDRNAAWNWGTLKTMQAAGSQAQTAPIDIAISQGHFTLTDRTPSSPAQHDYTGVDAVIENFSPRDASDVTLAVTLPNQQAGQVRIAGRVGPIDGRDFTRTPLDVRVRMSQAELADVEALFGQSSARAGRITLDARIKGRLAEGLAAAGQIRAEQLRLSAAAAPADVPLEADFKIKTSTQAQANAPGGRDYAVQIETGNLKLGATSLLLTGSISHLMTRPELDVETRGDSVALAGLLESAHAFGVGPPPGTKASGTAKLDLHATGQLGAPALSGRAEIRDLKLQGAKLPAAIEVSELRLTCDPAAITAAPFRTTMAGRTAVEISALSLRNYTERPRARIEIATQNARLEDLLGIAEAAGARPGFSATGIASVKAAIETNVGQPDDPTTITGQGSLSNVQIQAAQPARPVEVGGADLNFTGDKVRVENLRAKLAGSEINGWVQISNFDHPSASFDLKLNELNLAEMRKTLAAGTNAPQRAAASSRGLIPVALADAKPHESATPMIPAEGEIAIGRVVVEKLTASDLKSHAVIRDHAINLNRLSFAIFGGSCQGQLGIELTSGSPLISLNVSYGGVDVNSFLAAFSSGKGVITGRASGTLNVRGRQLEAGSLSGGGRLVITGGQIVTFDLARQVAILGKLAGLPTGDGKTDFRSFSSNLRFEGGRLFTTGLKLEMSQMTVTGNGVLTLAEPVVTDHDLLAQVNSSFTRNLGHDEQLTKALGVFTGGGLGVPLKMSGPVTQPSFRLNAEALARQPAERLIKQPDQTVKGILDLFTGKDKKSPEKKP